MILLLFQLSFWFYKYLLQGHCRLGELRLFSLNPSIALLIFFGGVGWGGGGEVTILFGTKVR